MQEWIVGMSIRAREHFNSIKDNRIRRLILKRLEGLQYNPEQQGKPMGGSLDGYFSVRAIGQRYRILYILKNDRVLVLVVTIGIRKEGDKRDVYRIAQKLVQEGHLDEEN